VRSVKPRLFSEHSMRTMFGKLVTKLCEEFLSQVIGSVQPGDLRLSFRLLQQQKNAE